MELPGGISAWQAVGMELFEAAVTGTASKNNTTPEAQGKACVIFLGESAELREVVGVAAAVAGLDFIPLAPSEQRETGLAGGRNFEPGRARIQAVVVHATSGCAPPRIPEVPVIWVGEVQQELWDTATRGAAFRFPEDHVVPLPEGTQWLVELLSHRDEAASAGELIGFLGGCGGAGVSTVVVMLAYALQKHRPVTLLDLDPAGAGVEVSLGEAENPGISWKDLHLSAGAMEPQQLVEALPRFSRLPVLGFGSADSPELVDDQAQGENSTAVERAVDALLRDGKMILADLGQGSEAKQRMLVERAQQVVMVVPARLSAVASSQKRLNKLPHHKMQLIVRGPFPEGLDAELVAQTLQLPLLGVLPKLRGVARASDEAELKYFAKHRAVQKLSRSMLESSGG